MSFKGAGRWDFLFVCFLPLDRAGLLTGFMLIEANSFLVVASYLLLKHESSKLSLFSSNSLQASEKVRFPKCRTFAFSSSGFDSPAKYCSLRKKGCLAADCQVLSVKAS